MFQRGGTSGDPGSLQMLALSSQNIPSSSYLLRLAVLPPSCKHFIFSYFSCFEPHWFFGGGVFVVLIFVCGVYR